MRLYGISLEDVASALTNPSDTESDAKGNLRVTGVDLNGREIIAVIAKENHDFLITTFPKN